MNITIITSMFAPIQTGTSFYSKNLATALVNAGCTVNLITVQNSSTFDNNYGFTIDRIPCFHFSVKNYFKHLRFTSFFPSNYRFINRRIKEIQPDVIILINHYLDIAFPAVYASQKNKTPLFVSVGTQMQSNNKIRNKILNIIDRAIVGNLIFPYASKIISWDKEIERYIKTVHNKKNAAKSHIIPYGVNGDTSIYKNYNHNYEQVNQIVGIGAIIEQRNYIFAINVFKELLAYYPRLVFKIIGHEYYKETRKFVEKIGLSGKVIFTGELQHNQVLEEIKKSTFGFTITTGRYTGLGTSTIETMLLGVPVISKSPEDLFGSVAKLEDFKNYIFLDGQNIKDAVDKLLIVLENEKIRRNIGISGRNFVNTNLNWENVAAQMIALFKNQNNSVEKII
jgi:glycosyltransferase involved in cell wall biosynthesis